MGAVSQLVEDATKYASALGYVEVNRGSMLYHLELHSRDVVFQSLSHVVQLHLFQQPGSIQSRKQEKRKQEKRRADQEQRRELHQAERDSLSRGKPRPPKGRSAQGQQQRDADQDKKGDQGDGEEEELFEPDVNEAWARALPRLVSCSEAIGFGVAVSEETYARVLHDIEVYEGALPPMVVPIEPSSEPVMTLKALQPSRLRIFFRRDPSTDDFSWLVMLPVILALPGGYDTKEQARTRLMSQDNFEVHSTGTDVQWLVLDPNEVFVYVPRDANLPRDDGAVVSNVSRCEPERRVEMGNRYAMAAANLVNARPPIPIIEKAGGAGKKKDASGENGTTNEDAREAEPLRIEAEKLTTYHDIEAPGKIEAFPAAETLSPALKRYREQQEDQHAERMDEKMADELRRAYRTMEDPSSVVLPTPVARKGWTLPEGKEIAQVPPAVPPAFYEEQVTKRLREAAFVWGLPVGVLLNYSIMEASSSMGSMGSTGAKSGTGGSTSGTTSTAWHIYETTMHAMADTLERWAAQVLKRMRKRRRDAVIARTIQLFAEHRLEEFYSRHGTEQQFAHRMITDSTTDDSVKRGLQYSREQQKEECMRAVGATDPAAMLSGKDAALADAKDDLLFKIPRVMTMQQLMALWDKSLLNPEGMHRKLIESLHIDESDLELPEAMADAREASVNPMPEAQPDDAGASGGPKKKAKSKK